MKVGLLQDVEVLLLEWDSFTVEIPELKLLRQYHTDAVSWDARLKAVLMKVPEREDQQNVVDELEHILKDGAILNIQGLGNAFFLNSHGRLY